MRTVVLFIFSIDLLWSVLCNKMQNIADTSALLPRWQQDCGLDVVTSLIVPNRDTCRTYLHSCSECCVAGFDPQRRECHLLKATPARVFTGSSLTDGCSKTCGTANTTRAEWVECPALADPIDGHVTYMDRRAEGGNLEAVFTCRHGYSLPENNVSVCLPNGSWNRPLTPNCTVARENVTLDVNGTSVPAVLYNKTWIMIQSRDTHDVNFNQTLHYYTHGFGNWTGDFWWGLKYLHLLTAVRFYTLRVEMEMNVTGVFYYQDYDWFRVSDSSDDFRLWVNGSSGTAGDALAIHNGRGFTTVDHDVDTLSTKNCALDMYPGGWWFSDCFGARTGALGGQPNGIAQTCRGSLYDKICILWTTAHGYLAGIKKIRMLIK